MERLRKIFIKLVIMIFSTVVNVLYAQEWIDNNKTPAVNYFIEIPEAGRWIELIKCISLNPSTKVSMLQFEKAFKLFLNDENILIEIGHPHIRSPNVSRIMISYSYHNELTKESAKYVIYETPSPRAFLCYFNENNMIQYAYYENRQEKYEIQNIVGQIRQLQTSEESEK
jgi:hypothetical protein